MRWAILPAELSCGCGGIVVELLERAEDLEAAFSDALRVEGERGGVGGYREGL